MGVCEKLHLFILLFFCGMWCNATSFFVNIQSFFQRFSQVHFSAVYCTHFCGQNGWMPEEK